MNLDQLPLAGLRVGISGAVPERQYWGEVRDLDRLILSFVSQLSTLVTKYGGQVVHGSQPLLTPVIAEATRDKAQGTTAALTLVASRLWGEPPEVTFRAARTAGAAVLLTPKVGEGDAGDPATRNDSLTAMRIVLAQEIDVLVAVGGKLHATTGFNPGVLEELTQARWHGVPCFIFAALGGFAGKLERQMIEEFSAGNMMENPVEMAMWSDTIDEYVGQLLLHLAKQRHELEMEYARGTYMPRHIGVYRAPSSTTTVDLDLEVAKRLSIQFAKFRKCFEMGDLRGVRLYLRNPSAAREDEFRPRSRIM
jgi:hypothetical protein